MNTNPAPLSTMDRRLQFAQRLCHKDGLAWTGITVEEREAYMDAAQAQVGQGETPDGD